MSSGPSNCGGLGFIWCTHPNTVISMSLKNPFISINPRDIRHLQLPFSRPSFDKYFNQAFKQTWHPFFNGLSFHIKPTISAHRFHINKFILIQFYVPFTSTPDHENPFPYTFPRFLFEWIDKVIKLSSSVAHLLMNHTFYFPSMGLLCLESSYRLRNNYEGLWGTPVRSCLESPSEKVTASLVENEGLISSVKIKNGNISRSRAEGTISLGEMNPWESEGSKFSSSVWSSHTSPSQVKGSNSLPI